MISNYPQAPDFIDFPWGEKNHLPIWNNNKVPNAAILISLRPVTSTCIFAVLIQLQAKMLKDQWQNIDDCKSILSLTFSSN